MTTITGTQGDDTLVGTGGDDFIDGGAGKNMISAGDGNDTILDSGSNSTIDGGSGTDRLILTRSQNTPFLATFTPGQATTLSDGTTIQNIESLDLRTGAGDDLVTFLPPNQDSQWSGGDGNDTAVIDLSNMTGGNILNRPSQNPDHTSAILLPNGAGGLFLFENVEIFHVTGGSGSDQFDGGDLDDIFYGGLGNDILLGNGGNDILRGDAGANTLDGGAGSDTAVFSGLRANYTIVQNADGSITVSAPGETDTLTNIEYMRFSDQTVATQLSGGTPNIVLNGTSGNDYFVGTSADDKIFGDSGNDSLTGEQGNDVLDGGNGFDTAYFHGDNAYINLTTGIASSNFDGNDSLSGIEAVFASGANVTIIGNDGPNQFTLQGGGINTAIGGGGGDQFYGNSGDDAFRGGTGTNSLNGGSGTDTAAYSLAPGSYIVTLNSDGSYTVKAPDLTDTLISIEQASFDATGQTLSMAAFAAQSFNPLLYVASYGDLIRGIGTNQDAAVTHYMTAGYYEGRSASFNALSYIASYSDLIRAFGDNQAAATSHYITAGYYEGRVASFNALQYIASYSDLIAGVGDNQAAATSHYITAGYYEGRVASFNALQYIASYSDLIAGVGDNQTAAYEHYIKYGNAEGRRASFNALQYVASYTDLIAGVGDNQTNAYEHYIKYGYGEGRSATFNALAYTASYADLMHGLGDNPTAAYEHYIKYGNAEGRTVSFDPVAYLLSYSDLQNAGLTAQTAAAHYIDAGFQEGRSASTILFDPSQTQHALNLGQGRVFLMSDSFEDWFSVSLTGGQAYDFSLSGGLNSQFELHDAHGVLLASDQDVGAGALIHYAATNPGTYYLVTASDTLSAANFGILAQTA